jgi:hypothetical protein
MWIQEALIGPPAAGIELRGRDKCGPARTTTGRRSVSRSTGPISTRAGRSEFDVDTALVSSVEAAGFG